ncbi:50S ribosomal protein L9 [Chloroflexota bacterium]
MKVIFLQEVPKVATAGEIKEVPNGYARNFLIPRKLALPAKPETITTVAKDTEKRAHGQAQTETELLEMANRLDGIEIIIGARVGTKERLYGSITTTDIANELEKTTGLAIDKRKIQLDEPIRQLRSYEMTIRLAKNIVPRIKLTVTREAS